MRWLALVAALGCDVATLGPDGPSPCGTLYPALRIQTACPGTLRVTIDGRDLPPDPRMVALAGATILPWPAWVRAGMPSYVEVGDRSVPFSAEPYTCQVITVSCP